MRCSRAGVALLGFCLLVLGGNALWTQESGDAGDPTPSELGLRRDLPAPAGDPRSGKDLDLVTQEVSEQLRCPMCQGMSVADSPSASARAIKDEVRSLLAEGFSEDQVKQYFEGTYGEFVLLSPKRKGLNWLLWLAPGTVFLGGLAWIAVSRRSRRETEEENVDKELDPYLERVRNLAQAETSSEHTGS